jgi:DNA-directed RNA polymerase specialized sigma24 family protein
MTDTGELLRRYEQEGSEQAFSEVVQRHIDLVYSTAARRVGGDISIAEDITQLVFVDFARKARMRWNTDGSTATIGHIAASSTIFGAACRRNYLLLSQ